MMKVVKNICLASALALGTVACGGGDDTGTDPPVEGPFTHYVTNTLLVPTDNTTANMYGLDLDLTEPLRVDNTLGNILGVLAMQGADVQMQIDEAVAMGDIVILHSVQAKDLVNASADWHVYLGETATPPTFMGTDMFTLAADSPMNANLGGAISGGEFKGGPSTVEIKLSIVQGGMPVTLKLIGARVESEITATTCDGKLGGAITKEDLDNDLIPTIADLMNSTVMNDPGCQMVPPMCGSSAEFIINTFDKGITCTAANEAEVCPTEAPTCGPDPGGGTNMKCGCGMATCMGSLPGDGGISVAEIKNNSLIKSLLTPDVDLLDANMVFQEDPAMRDGEKDSLSLGVAFTCVNGVFTVPSEQ